MKSTSSVVAVVFFLTIIATLPVTAACYASVTTIPVNCTGIITQDTTSGACRTVACTAGANTITALACDKPDSGVKQYFEMYQQAVAGTPPTICLGATCMSNTGYLKSQNYPFCVNTTNQTNATGQNNFSFTVTSTPSSSNIAINGASYGPTPNTISLAPGSYTVNVSQTGFNSNTTTITLTANTSISLTLQQVTQSNGTNQTNVTTNVCYTSMAKMPSSCNGTISQDVILSSGCRSVTCTNGANALRIQACNKPGDYQAQYFEMIQQTLAGTPPTICIGTTCIANGNGYAKSQNFPLCIGTTNQTNATGPTNVSLTINSVPTGSNIAINGTSDGTTPKTISLAPGTYSILASQNGFNSNTTTITLSANTSISLTLQPVTQSNGTNQTNTTAVCYTTLTNIPATCAGGSITNDMYNGCRSITCTNSTSSMSILACDKPTSSNPTNFEMYKQAQTGSLVTSICIGNTCISNNGFITSPAYPLCYNAKNALLTLDAPYTGSIAKYGEWATHDTLTDGDLLSGGQNAFITPQWTMDLGPNPGTISATDFGGHYQGLPNAVTDWTVEYSNDRTNWLTAIAHWNPGTNPNQLLLTTLAPVTNQRYWRFTLNSNSCPNGCWVSDFGLGSVSTSNTRLTANMTYTGPGSLFGDWSPTHLTDGDVGNSGGQNPNIATPQWTIDLGPNAANDIINTTDFGGHYQNTGNAVTNWTVEYSDDNATWTAAVANWNPGGPADQLINKTFAPVIGKRYWRFTMNSNSCPNGCWVDDFGLWGTVYQRTTTGKPYTGSTAFYGDWGSSTPTLTDRNGTSGGQNPDIIAPQWTIDLGANNHTINTTDFSGQYQGTGNAVTNWTVEYSTDNTSWSTAVANWNPGGTKGQFINATFSPVTGKRYWRFTMNSNTCPNGCWVDDFGLWGS